MRALAFTLSAVLTAGPVGLCAGWQASSEARMACCVEEVGCPMHAGDHTHAGATHKPTQSEADDCCASNEHRNSPSTTQLAAVIVSLPVALTTLRPPIASRLFASHASIAGRAQSVPRHLLLSVFLI